MASSEAATRPQYPFADPLALSGLWKTIHDSHLRALSYEASRFDDQNSSAIQALALNGVATNLQDALGVLERTWPTLSRGTLVAPAGPVAAPTASVLRELIGSCVRAAEAILTARAARVGRREGASLAQCLSHLFEAHRLLCGRLP